MFRLQPAAVPFNLCYTLLQIVYRILSKIENVQTTASSGTLQPLLHTVTNCLQNIKQNRKCLDYNPQRYPSTILQYTLIQIVYRILSKIENVQTTTRSGTLQPLLHTVTNCPQNIKQNRKCIDYNPQRYPSTSATHCYKLSIEY